MQMSSSSSAPRRSRAKSADDGSTATPKKSRSRKASARPEPDSNSVPLLVDVVALHPDSTELQGMIATAAYFLAAERNFAPGQELDDWLEAERRVRSRQT